MNTFDQCGIYFYVRSMTRTQFLFIMRQPDPESLQVCLASYLILNSAQ